MMDQLNYVDGAIDSIIAPEDVPSASTAAQLAMAAKQALRLHYWKIPGRASLSYVFARAAGYPIEFVDEDTLEEKETYKKASPFGQLPVLTDAEHGVTMAQSAAIAAYVARVAGLDGGADLAAYAQTLQYIELDAELTQFCGKALYTGETGSPERVKAWEEAKQKIDVKLTRVVDNLGGNKFLHGADSPKGPDYAIATITWLLSGPTLWPEIRSQFPALAAHFANVTGANAGAKTAFEEMDAWEAYYTRA